LECISTATLAATASKSAGIELGLDGFKHSATATGPVEPMLFGPYPYRQPLAASRKISND
jgi:hypothetical protein